MSFQIRSWEEMSGPPSAESKTYCALDLQLGGRSVLEVSDKRSQSTRDFVRVSAYPLACWLVENFFRLLYEPTRGGGQPSLSFVMAHDLPSIGLGYIWPKLRIFGDGKSVAFCFGNSAGETYAPVNIRANVSEEWLDVRDARNAISDFVEKVIMRLNDCGIADVYLPSLWQSVRAEFNDSDILTNRRIEALLGLEPDESPQAVEKWEAIAKDIGATIFDLAGVVTVDDAQDTLRLLEAQDPVERGELARVMSELGHFSDAVAWQLGMNAALRVRELLGNREEHLDQIPFLPSSFETARMTASRTEPEEFRVVMRAGRPQTQRFEGARILGDFLLFPNEDFGVVSKAHTFRQKAQRSFAAELLMPTQALKRVMAEGGDFQDDETVMGVADKFLVSERVVSRQLENRGFLSSNH